MYAATGSNIFAVNGGVVAIAQVTGAAPTSSYSQSLTLEPATRLRLPSAYLWNMGDSANHVNTVIDFNRRPRRTP